MSPKPLICVIDDDDRFRRALCVQLEDAGYQVAEASNGQDGLDLMKKIKAPLAIVDIIMPEREGISTIQEIKTISPATRILAVSGGGFGDPGLYLESARMLGADDTLAKPFRPVDLLDRVKRLLA
jgi:DNA-binding response OmpR family regulator